MTRLAVRLVFTDGAQRPRVLRGTIESLGAAWIKLGQALAFRFDLLPDAYCREFFRLLNQVEPFPYAVVQQVIKQELGREIHAVFAKFEVTPFAAASIGQVHRAVLMSGEQVAVKIQRPTVAADIRADIRLMYVIGWILDRLHVFGGANAVSVIADFERWTREELDFRNEARHANVLRENAGDVPAEHHARVFGGYTTRMVLTAELLAGPTVLDLVNAGSEPGCEDAERRRRLAAHVCWNTLNQIYTFGYFHADLHPANLIALSDNSVGYVDFGITGRLSAATRDSLAAYARALFWGKVEQAAGEFMRWLSPPNDGDPRAIRKDFEDLFLKFHHTIRSGQSGANLSALQIEMLQLVRRHRLVLSPDVTTYFKAIATVDAVLYALDPAFDLFAYERAFFTGMASGERRIDRLLPQAWRNTADTWQELRSLLGESRSALQEGKAWTADLAQKVERIGLAVAVWGGLLGAGNVLTSVVGWPFSYLAARLTSGIGAVILVLFCVRLRTHSRRLGRTGRAQYDFRSLIVQRTDL